VLVTHEIFNQTAFDPAKHRGEPDVDHSKDLQTIGA
jgi:hypothetical protein